MATDKYTRTVSADDAGFNYEMKMTAIVALRLYNQVDEFYLANNFEKGGKFDDLVFSTSSNGKWTTWFVQLKHKQRTSLASKKVTVASLNSTTNSNKSDYNLCMYFDSYKAICRRFNPGSTDPIFSRGYDSAKFILFTNAHLNEDVSQRGFQSIDLPLLSTVGKKVEKNIQFDAKKDADIFKNVNEKVLLTDFLKRFALCTHQACEDECDDVLDEEIKKAASYLTSNEVKYVRGQLYDNIRRWYKTGEYLTKDKVKSLLSASAMESQSGKKGTVGVVFLPSYLQQVYSVWKNDRCVFLASKDGNTTICTAALKQLQLLDEPNQYLSFSQLDSDSFMDHLVTKFKNQNGIVLIIEMDCANTTPKLNASGEFLLSLYKSNEKNKIILVATDDNENARKLATILPLKKRMFNCTLVNLTKESKASIIERPVLFQGYETPLSGILPMNKALDTVFNMNAISEVLAGQKISIGIKPIEPIPYYVTRVLIRQMLSSDVFNLCKTGTCFAVSRVTFDMAKKLFSAHSASIATSTDFLKNPTTCPRILVLDGPSPRSDFQEALKKNNNMHWLEKSSNNWIWKESGSNVFECGNYFSDRLHYVKTDDITQIRDKVVLVTAEPGMGKSTLLMHMAAETKVRQPNVWVVFVSLNDFADKMDSPEFCKNVESNVKAIVAEAAEVSNMSSKFDARLFDYCYSQTGNMIVLLDGFDEITPHYTKEGLEIIRVLKESIIRGVWISSRPILRDLLQKATNTLSYSIKPFETSDQKIFLQKFWQQSIADMKKENVTLFIDKVLELIRPSFGGEVDLFTGIPLQTRMVAELFENDIRNFHISGNISLPAKINCLQLFEAFVEKKLNILDEKAKVTGANAVSRDNREVIKKERENRLMKLALLTLLKPDEYTTLEPPIRPFDALELKEEVNSGAERTGIVVSFKGDTPQFIHRTFAEYFGARFFETYWNHNVKFTSSDSFFSPSFNFVRYLLNRLLTKGCALHNAILDRDCESIMHLVKSRVNVNEFDKAGRTCLHLAASLSGSEEVINELLKAGADPNLKDKTLKLTALEWGLKTNDIGNIAPLLSSKNVKTVPTDAFPLDLNSFKITVRGDYLCLFNLLLDRGIVGVVGVDVLPPYTWLGDEIVDGLTYLHLAAAFNASQILEYLLRNNIRDSKLWLLEKKTPLGETALLIAACRGSNKAFDVLLNAGSDILVEMPSGRNLIELAIDNENEHVLIAVLNKLKDKQINAESLLPNALSILVRSKMDWAGVALALIISYYPNLYNCLVKKDMPLIAFAISKGNTLAVKLLLEYGANVNLVVRSFSLLHMAVSGGFDDIVDTLLSRPGIEVDPVDDNGRTPLYVAATQGNLSLFEMLVKRGARLDTVTKEGNDISHAAAASRDLRFITWLSEKGVSFTRENLKGETAADLFKSTCSGDVTSFSPTLVGQEKMTSRQESRDASFPSSEVFPSIFTLENDGQASTSALAVGPLGKVPTSQKVGRNRKKKGNAQSAPKTEAVLQCNVSGGLGEKVPLFNWPVVSGNEQNQPKSPTVLVSGKGKKGNKKKANDQNPWIKINSATNMGQRLEAMKALSMQVGGAVAEKAHSLLESSPNSVAVQPKRNRKKKASNQQPPKPCGEPGKNGSPPKPSAPSKKTAKQPPKKKTSNADQPNTEKLSDAKPNPNVARQPKQAKKNKGGTTEIKTVPSFS